MTLPIKQYIFDLDGTLFDTRDLVKSAYERAGIIMPQDVWGKPAELWLPQHVGAQWKMVHQRKNGHYVRLVNETELPRTSALSALIELALNGVECYVITAASWECANALLTKYLKQYHYSLLSTGCDIGLRLLRLRKIARNDRTVYVDDDEITCDEVAFALRCHVVRYNLLMSKEEVLEEWMRSSSLPGRTNGLTA